MVTSLNVNLFQWIHEGAGVNPIIDTTAIFFGQGGPYLLMVWFVALWFFVNKNKKIALIEAAWAAIIGLMINQMITFFYFHPRPYMLGLCTPLFDHGPETSFPSDHATLMFAAAVCLVLHNRWMTCGIPLLILAGLTAWGRVYSGIHFPFDMAGSFGVGLVSLWVVHLSCTRLLPLNRKLAGMIDQMLEKLIKKRKTKK